jgi:hypothetical protein
VLLVLTVTAEKSPMREANDAEPPQASSFVAMSVNELHGEAPPGEAPPGEL